MSSLMGLESSLSEETGGMLMEWRDDFEGKSFRETILQGIINILFMQCTYASKETTNYGHYTISREICMNY